MRAILCTALLLTGPVWAKEYTGIYSHDSEDFMLRTCYYKTALGLFATTVHISKFCDMRITVRY